MAKYRILRSVSTIGIFSLDRVRTTDIRQTMTAKRIENIIIPMNTIMKRHESDRVVLLLAYCQEFRGTNSKCESGSMIQFLDYSDFLSAFGMCTFDDLSRNRPKI